MKKKFRIKMLRRSGTSFNSTYTSMQYPMFSTANIMHDCLFCIYIFGIIRLFIYYFMSLETQVYKSKPCYESLQSCSQSGLSNNV